MKTLFTTCVAALLTAASIAQSPGGVSSGLVSWFNADAGTSTTTNGAAIASWIDQSGVANATQATASAQPFYYSNIINGHPAVRTTTGRYFNVNYAAINNVNYTVLTVTRRLAGGSFNHIMGIQGTTAGYSYFSLGYSGASLIRHVEYGNFINLGCEAYNATTEVPAILSCQFDDAIGKQVWRIRDGIKTSSSGTNKSHYAITNNGFIGRGGEGYGFNGYIAEVIVYNRPLTTNEKIKINTYLSVKYGLSVPMAEHMYPLDATFHNDVFGIAQDNAFALSQTTGESTALDDILQISSPSSMNNGDYMICGNDNGNVSFDPFSGTDCTISGVMARDWKVNHIGDCGTVTLSFDMTGVAGFTGTDLHVLIDRDGDGYDDETPISGSYSAPYFTATGISLPDHVKFTLCTANTHYYAVVSGPSSGSIWAVAPDGTPGLLSTNCSKMDLTVNAGVTVDNDWASFSCRNFTVNGTFNSGALSSQNVIVFGNIVCEGTWNGQYATLSMQGADAQTISGSRYLNAYSVSISNAVGVTLNNLGLRLTNNLGLPYGGVLNTNSKLVLLSNSSNTAEIQSLSEGTINGSVMIYRYRPASTAGWVNLSSSVQNATIADWNDDIITTGFPGSDYPSYNFKSVQTYNETAAGDETQGYVGATNVTNPLVPGLGYMVYMPTGAATIDVLAPINSGDITMPITYTDNGSGRGWNIVGNPYPATIDWTSSSWTKTNIANEVHVWNSNSNQYVSYTGLLNQSPLIAPGQSFCIRANGASPQLIVREGCKAKSHGTFRTLETSNDYLTLHVQMNNLEDQTIIARTAFTTKSFDDSYDAMKLRSPVAEVPYMASLDDAGNNLSINAINNEAQETIIPIRIEAGVTGIYTLTVTGLDAFSQGACVTLEDVFTGTTYVLSESTPIEMPLEAGDKTLRYQLRLGGTSLSAVTDAGCSTNDGGTATVVTPVNTTSVVEWHTENGTLISTTTPTNGVAKIKGLASGNYTAQISNNGACGTTTVAFAVNESNKIAASAVVMPTSCANTDDGAISISISGGDGPYTITWANGSTGSMIENATPGKYVAMISDKNGCTGKFEFELPTASALRSKFEVSNQIVELVNGQATVTFTNFSDEAESVAWNFGDGSDESSEDQPTHTYQTAGTYDVMLKAMHDNCESVSTKTVAVTDQGHAEEFAADIKATMTDNGVQLTFSFDQQKSLKISAYNVVGQQLIEPIVGVYGKQTIMFSDRRYASQALIEVTDMSTGDKALIRMGR